MAIRAKRARRIAIGALSLLLLLKGEAAQAKAWPDNTIGAGFGVQLRPEIATPDDIKRISAAGFSYIRFDMHWSDVEHKQGEYDWSAFDRFIEQLRKYHLKSVVILNGSNPLYTAKVSVPPEKAFGNSWSYAAPTKDNEVAAFTAFAAAAVAHYGTNDVIWEIWNEPDMLAFWPPAPDADAFAILANATCLAIRKVKPHATIIGPAIARLPGEMDFLHEHFFKVFMQSPAIKCLDAISVHPYRHKDSPPETVISDYKTKVRPFVADYTPEGQKPLPVVDSEWGYTTTDHATPEQQADYALRIHLANLIAGVPLSILYEWKDSPHMSDESEMHYGLIDSAGNNKPGADIIDNVLPRIKNAVIVRRLSVEDDSCFVLLIRQPDGHYQLLAWVGRDQLGAPAVLQVKDSGSKKDTTYSLSLIPQVMDIASSVPQVTVVEGSVK